MPRNPEDDIQADIVAYLRLVAPTCKTYHVPNGGLRSKREAAKLKWTGVLAGVPDLNVVPPNGRIHYIEVKTPTGVLSDAQKDFRDWCLSNNIPWMCARSVADVGLAIVQWGLPHRDAVLA